MTGPYRINVFLTDRPVDRPVEPDFVLTWEENRDELREGENVAWRFYNSGGGATLVGTVRSATFAVGKMLEPGEAAYVQVIGREVALGVDRLGEDATVRRDAAGNLYSTLGSRWSRERRFIGA